MKYQLTLTFKEDSVSKEKIDWLVSTLNFKKGMVFITELFEVEAVELAVADEPPDEDGI